MVLYRAVYTTSVLGTAPLKFGMGAKTLGRHVLFTRPFLQIKFCLVGTPNNAKSHLYFLITTVCFVTG